MQRDTFCSDSIADDVCCIDAPFDLEGSEVGLNDAATHASTVLTPLSFHEAAGVAKALIDAPVAALIARADGGDSRARNELFSAMYQRLRRLARREVARHGELMLGATTLVHEVFLDMSQREPTRFADQARFLGYAARAMRGVAIDHMRSRHAQKRGGHTCITDLEGDETAPLPWHEDLLPIHDALDALETLDPELAQVVDLKFFYGFSSLEIAALQQVSERTVHRHWQKARALLHHALRPSAEG